MWTRGSAITDTLGESIGESLGAPPSWRHLDLRSTLKSALTGPAGSRRSQGSRLPGIFVNPMSTVLGAKPAATAGDGEGPAKIDSLCLRTSTYGVLRDIFRHADGKSFKSCYYEFSDRLLNLLSPTGPDQGPFWRSLGAKGNKL